MHDDFGNGGHTYSIAAYYAEVLVFGRGLEGGAGSAYIYTMHQTNAKAFGYFVSLADEFVVVSFCHCGEARSQFFVVFATQRVFGEEVDLVGNCHDVAYAEVLVHAARSIGYIQCINAECAENTHGEGDGLHVITLVVVETALHSNNAFPVEVAEDKVAAVSLYGGYGHIWYLAVGDDNLIVDMVYKCAEAAAEDYGGLWHVVYTFAKKKRCFFDFSSIVNNGFMGYIVLFEYVYYLLHGSIYYASVVRCTSKG